MKQIKDFRINLDSDSLKNVEKIKNFIENFVSHEDLKDLSSNIGNLLDVPTEIINKKIKQIVYDNFDYYDKYPKFKINFSFLSLAKYFFLFTALVLF